MVGFCVNVNRIIKAVILVKLLRLFIHFKVQPVQLRYVYQEHRILVIYSWESTSPRTDLEIIFIGSLEGSEIRIVKST